MNFFSILEKRLMPLAELVGKNKYLIAIRDGFLISTPLLIIGSFFILIANFPIPGWADFWISIFGVNWENYLMRPVAATFDIMAVFAVMGIGYSFARQMNVNAIFGAAVSLVGFFTLMEFKIPFNHVDLTSTVNVSGIYLKWVGSSGIFLGMISAFLAVHIYAWVLKRGWIIKMPEGVPPTVTQSFAALIPVGVVMLAFFLINIVLSVINLGNAFNLVFNVLQTPLVSAGGSLLAMVIAYLFLHLFWFFGINGSAVVGAVYNPILRVLTLENLDAFKAGEQLPHIITGAFQDMFATFGGGGSTLSLLIAMFIFCRSQRIRSLGKLSFIPGLFGINEPIIFGLPIVLNPILLIPFILVPTFNIITTYFVMQVGLVPYTNGVMLPWTTPVVISGFLSTDWRGAVWQIILLVIGVFMYAPFIKMLDKQYLKDEKNVKIEEKISFDDVKL
ncbi:MAG: PTS cellobiose transporter subunit IIC [Alphaproteobacteria bacterium]|jgi:PTS system cellobiose-specific IIC component|nr:PTS cellobiose transporter subunit IIC [Alphaproteobacteria bacterium]